MNKKTLKLNQENNRLDVKVLDENKKVFTDIICYLRGSQLSDYDIEYVRHDITNMILAAQERGDNIDDVIGKDYKQFCDDIIESLPKKTTKEKILSAVDIICCGMAVLLFINTILSDEVFQMIANVFNHNAVNYNVPFSVFDAASIFIFLGAATILVNVITKNAFDEKQLLKKVEVAAIPLFIVLLGVGLSVGKKVLFTVNVFVVVGIVVGLILAHKVLEKYS